MWNQSRKAHAKSLENCNYPRSTSWRSILSELTSVSGRSSSTDATSAHCGSSLCTDEACFTLETAHNSHIWPRDNPHAICFSVTVWAGIVVDIVVGSHLLTAQRDHDFLETVLPGLLAVVPLAVRHRFWFQHDGAPAHCGEDARQWLTAACPGRWIGPRGPIAWLPQSPNLTPMDFCLMMQVYAVSHGKTSSGNCDSGRCRRHVKAYSMNAVRNATSCLEMGGGLFRITIVAAKHLWFDYLIACAIRRWRVSWKVNITGHIRVLYNVSYFSENK
jgi:hypothetical protein